MESKDLKSRPVGEACSTDLNNSSRASGSEAPQKDTGSNAVSTSSFSASASAAEVGDSAQASGLKTDLLIKALFSRNAILCLLASGFAALLLWTSLSYFVVRESELARIDSHYSDLITLATSTDTDSFAASMDHLLHNSHQLEFPLKGYAVYSNGYGSEPVLSGGDFSSLGRIPDTTPASSRYFNLSEHYDTTVSSGSINSLLSPSNNVRINNTDQVVVHLRADTTRVAKNLQAYLIRTSLLSVPGILLATALFTLILSNFLRRAIAERSQSGRQQKQQLHGREKSASSREVESEHTVLTKILSILEQGNSSLEDSSSDFLASERLSHFADIGEYLLWESDSRLRLTHVAGNEKLLWKTSYSGQSRSRHSLQEALASKGVEKNTFRQVVDSLHASKHWQGSLVTAQEEDARTYRIAAEKIPGGSQITGFRGILLDTTEDNAARERLQQEARMDDLTGVANRRGFLTDVQNALDSSVKTGARHCICMLDLDRFKQVNDTCGHAAGDMLLVHIADILRHEVRVSDIVARLGGDEFALLMTNCPVERAAEVAESIRKKIDDYRFNWNGQSHSVGTSIGVVEISDEFSNAKSILVAADACCYRAKRSGRNQVQLHSADDELLLAQQAEVDASNRIVEALEEGRIELVFQAVASINRSSGANVKAQTIVASQAGEKILYEVSSQLRETDGRYSPESGFLPDAERFNLIAQVDLYMFKRALSWLSDQLQAQDDRVSPEHLQISVNVCGLSLQDPVYQQGLLNLLESSPLDNAFVCIEIDEAFLAKKLESVYGFLEKLGELGCKLILDKLTNGVSVLAAVSQLPVSHAKLDETMTRGIRSDPLRQMMLRTVEDIADHFGIQLIALDIDEPVQWEELEGQRIALAQGAIAGQLQTPDQAAMVVSEGVLAISNTHGKAA